MILKKDVTARVDGICRWFNVSKSGFYKHLKIELKRRDIEETVVRHLYTLRKSGIMCGARKAQIYLSKYFSTEIGRDRLFDIMEKNDLQCCYYKKRKLTSNGRKSDFPNLLKERPITCFGEAIATDITYIHLPNNKFCYISIISDIKTRMILGYNISKNLLVDSSLKALKMVLKKFKLPANAIHHSDHGVQYTSNEYTKYLINNGMQISMTGKAKCYDNAQAERIFNTLKHEYGFKKVFNGIQDVKSEFKLFLQSYNKQRIHAALGYKTPYEVYMAA
ncbi:MAG: IS3 family transposase [Candidatus Cloacimonetes bacterium]|nr:IS3 family transposase [Candidatus Cloacimonadota bacterium]